MSTPATVTPPRSRVDERLAREAEREAQEAPPSLAGPAVKSKSAYQKRIDQLVAKNSASEERVRQLEQRIAELKRLLNGFRDEAARWRSEYFKLKGARTNVR